MKYKWKRWVSMVLVCAFVIGILPANALAVTYDASLSVTSEKNEYMAGEDITVLITSSLGITETINYKVTIPAQLELAEKGISQGDGTYVRSRMYNSSTGSCTIDYIYNEADHSISFTLNGADTGSGTGHQFIFFTKNGVQEKRAEYEFEAEIQGGGTNLEQGCTVAVNADLEGSINVQATSGAIADFSDGKSQVFTVVSTPSTKDMGLIYTAKETVTSLLDLSDVFLAGTLDNWGFVVNGSSTEVTVGGTSLFTVDAEAEIEAVTDGTHVTGFRIINKRENSTEAQLDSVTYHITIDASAFETYSNASSISVTSQLSLENKLGDVMKDAGSKSAFIKHSVGVDSISKWGADSKLVPGESVPFTINFKNNNGEKSGNLYISDMLPLKAVSADKMQELFHEVNASDLTVKIIPDGTTNGAGTVTNNVNVTSINETDADGNQYQFFTIEVLDDVAKGALVQVQYQAKLIDHIYVSEDNITTQKVYNNYTFYTDTKPTVADLVEGITYQPVRDVLSAKSSNISVYSKSDLLSLQKKMLTDQSGSLEDADAVQAEAGSTVVYKLLVSKDKAGKGYARYMKEEWPFKEIGLQSITIERNDNIVAQYLLQFYAEPTVPTSGLDGAALGAPILLTGGTLHTFADGEIPANVAYYKILPVSGEKSIEIPLSKTQSGKTIAGITITLNGKVADDIDKNHGNINNVASIQFLTGEDHECYLPEDEVTRGGLNTFMLTLQGEKQVFAVKNGVHPVDYSEFKDVDIAQNGDVLHYVVSVKNESSKDKFLDGFFMEDVLPSVAGFELAEDTYGGETGKVILEYVQSAGNAADGKEHSLYSALDSGVSLSGNSLTVRVDSISELFNLDLDQNEGVNKDDFVRVHYFVPVTEELCKAAYDKELKNKANASAWQKGHESPGEITATAIISASAFVYMSDVTADVYKAPYVMLKGVTETDTSLTYTSKSSNVDVPLASRDDEALPIGSYLAYKIQIKNYGDSKSGGNDKLSIYEIQDQLPANTTLVGLVSEADLNSGSALTLVKPYAEDAGVTFPYTASNGAVDHIVPTEVNLSNQLLSIRGNGTDPIGSIEKSSHTLSFIVIVKTTSLKSEFTNETMVNFGYNTHGFGNATEKRLPNQQVQLSTNATFRRPQYVLGVQKKATHYWYKDGEAKKPIGTSIDISDNPAYVEWTISLFNDGESSADLPLDEMTLTDVLPDGYTFISASAGWTADTSAGSGEVVLKYTGSPAKLNRNGSIALTIVTKSPQELQISDNTILVTLDSEAGLKGIKSGDYGTRVDSKTIKNDASIFTIMGFGVYGVKTVQNDRDGATGNPVNALPGDTVTYKMKLSNASPTQMQDVILVDKLPYVDDTRIINQDSKYKRDSAFAMQFPENNDAEITVSVGGVALAGTDYTVAYTKLQNGDDIDSKWTSSDWDSTLDASSHNALRITISKAIANNNAIEVTYKAVVDKDAVVTGVSAVAYNTFAYKCQVINGSSWIPFALESSKTGVQLGVTGIEVKKDLLDKTGNINTNGTDVFSFVLEQWDLATENWTAAKDISFFDQNSDPIGKTDENGIFTVVANQATTLYMLASGNYRVRELSKAGYVLSNVIADVVEDGTTAVFEHLEVGKVYYSTFTNVPRGSTSPVSPSTGSQKLTVQKAWNDKQQNKRPTSVKVQLYRNNVASGSPVVLNEANKWTHTWSSLDNSSKWTVDEVDVPSGYLKTVVTKMGL